MKILNPRLWVFVLLLFSTIVEAAPIEYDVNRIIGRGSVVGTIITDGTLGPITRANISSYSLMLYDGTDSTTIMGSTGIRQSGPSYLSATMANLIFDFDGPEASSFGFSGFDNGFWTWTFVTRVTYSDYEVVNHEIPHSLFHVAGANHTGQQIVATAKAISLSEPESLILLGLGFSVLALIRIRKQDAGRACPII